MKLQSILKYIDIPIEWVGKAAGWLILPLTGIVLYNVLIARGVFKSSLVWGCDVTYMLSGSLFILAAAYVLRIGGHIRIDFLHERFRPRTKAIIEVLFYLVIFFPLMAVLIKYSINYAYEAWVYKEVTWPQFNWRGPLYPFKAVMPVGLCLLGIQGIAEFIRNLVIVVKGTGK